MCVKHVGLFIEVDQMFYRQSIQIPPQQLGMLFSLRGICVLIGGSLIKPGLKLVRLITLLS